jgi:predicted small lipoprotein YifL
MPIDALLANLLQKKMMTMSNRLGLLAGILACSAMLTACGLKGDLYLPEPGDNSPEAVTDPIKTAESDAEDGIDDGVD